MEEVIHINIGGYITEDEAVSVSKFRLWPALLAYAQWTLKNIIPGHNLIRSGIGLSLVNNLAVAVEGFVADMVVENLATNDKNKSPKLVFLESKATWHDKKKLFNENFEKGLESYAEFEAVEILFNLRNNMLHGLTHTEQTKRKIDSEEWIQVTSINQKYQKARDFFISKALMPDLKTHSSAELLWKLEIAVFLFSQVQIFLTKIVSENNSPKFVGIDIELKNALSL